MSSAVRDIILTGVKRLKLGLNSHIMKTLIRVISIFALLFAAGNALAAAKINTLEKDGLFGSYKDTGIAIRGYDTVAYFTLSKPVKGDEKYSIDWNDATWLFSTQEHADLFKNDPEMYAPQYGGYCAYGVAQNYLVKIEADQWRIVDDKLYLNYDKGVQKKWLKDIPGFNKKADEQFFNLLETH